MTAPGGRIPLTRQPDDEHAWTYLQPVADAERSWGNPPVGEFALDHHTMWWTLDFTQPLHIDRLRDTFAFPDGVELIDEGPRTSVVDGDQTVSLDGARRPGFRRAATPSGYEKDDSRSSRLVRRLLGVKDADR